VLVARGPRLRVRDLEAEGAQEPGRSGRSFRAKLKIERREDDPTRWKVDFDEEWATAPPKEREEAAAAASGEGDDEETPEIVEQPEAQRAAAG
jgi:hypothetical protein